MAIASPLYILKAMAYEIRDRINNKRLGFSLMYPVKKIILPEIDRLIEHPVAGYVRMVKEASSLPS